MFLRSTGFRPAIFALAVFRLPYPFLWNTIFSFS
jgi:hypothetical protein